MRYPTLKAVLAIFLLAPVAALRAQDAPPSPAPASAPADTRDYAQEIRDVMRDAGRNMAEKGIDPAQFMMKMREQMIDGSFDVAETQKELVAKGVLDDEMVQTMRTASQKLIAGTLKQRLGVTDEEWAVILPKLTRVLSAQANSGEAATGGGGRMGGMMMMGGMGGGPSGESARAMGDLRAAIKDKDASDAQIAEKLQQLRAAREQAKTELSAARQDLKEILTARQEAILAGMGIL